ncbi:hypothetical protein [Pelagicoccus sp. SDUM812003]|uniref:hypothetical protein n=1 Tax=Pelagicoccus sp. SDUM812003 TaxID=3041267 RepID=UPI00280EBBDB|nr:hypothetical protein [Pelagicoccus sp. SDUM812003]MDQ8203403.1 hypothetical protein [Pelagicoccus sp. SDUM812003]
MKPRTKYLALFSALMALLLVLANWPDGTMAQREMTAPSPPETAEAVPAEATQERPQPSVVEAARSEPSTSYETDLALSLDPERLEVDPRHPHQLGKWLVSIDPAPSKWDAQTSFTLSTTLPDGSRHALRLRLIESSGPEKGTFSGAVIGSDSSQAILSYVRDSVAGVIRLPEQGISWEIRNHASGRQLFEKVDLQQLKPCAACAHDR